LHDTGSARQGGACYGYGSGEVTWSFLCRPPFYVRTASSTPSSCVAPESRSLTVLQAWTEERSVGKFCGSVTQQ
jgi:hypothetical protein